MDQELQNFYKLTLAHDLILFMMALQNDGLSKEQKARRTNQILQAWEKRVDANLKVLAEEHINEIHEATMEDKDVLKIIQELHTHEPSLIRKEFKREVRKTVFRSFDEQKS